MSKSILVKPNVKTVRFSENRGTPAPGEVPAIAKKSAARPSTNQFQAPTKQRQSGILKLAPKMFVLGGLLAVLVFSIENRDQKSPDAEIKVEKISTAEAEESVSNEERIIVADAEDSYRDTVPVGEISPVIYGGAAPKRQVPIVYNKRDAEAQLITSGSVGVPALPSFEEKSFKIRVEEKLQRAKVEDMKSKVKFISGLIAVHRPSIPDCGLVAREIVELSAERGVDPFFVAAIISIESRFGQHERSHVGATGLMQLMPRTAAGMVPGVGRHLTDVATNIKLGIEYFQELEQRYRGNRAVALAAYNWGPGNVDRVGRNPRRFPSSVARYAKTILERHYNWSNHYRKAKESASALELG